VQGRIGFGVRAAYHFFYEGVPDETDLFRQVVSGYLHPSMVVLDAGCGTGTEFSHDWKRAVRRLVGCDLNGAERNPNISEAVRCSLRDLPFPDATFDLIFSRYVLEHLPEPDAVFREWARVLKPGGLLIVLTPNKYHYVPLLSRLTSHRFHEQVGKIRGRNAEDIFPTVYRANSRREIERLAAGTGLRITRFITREVRPAYLFWFLPAFLLGVAYERLVNRFEFLAGLRVSIIAVMQR
jgi:SAM-dependent methyltransferase